MGRTLRVGTKATIAVWSATPLQDDNARSEHREQNAGVMKQLARAHETKAGIYGAVLIEVRSGGRRDLADGLT